MNAIPFTCEFLCPTLCLSKSYVFPRFPENLYVTLPTSSAFINLHLHEHLVIIIKPQNLTNLCLCILFLNSVSGCRIHDYILCSLI